MTPWSRRGVSGTHRNLLELYIYIDYTKPILITYPQFCRKSWLNKSCKYKLSYF